MPIENEDPTDNSQIQRYRKAQIFRDVLDRAFREGLSKTKMVDAADWFRQKAKVMGKDVTPEDLMSDEAKLRSRFEYGQMYSYYYVPKYKDNRKVLPYYDIFPLIFPIEPAKGGFYGINMHYLGPRYRAALMDELFNLKFNNNNRFDASTKLVLSYELLKKASKLAAFKPCFKHYLSKFVYSRFYKIEAIEWNIALFLPTERFIHATRQQVWTDSRKKF